MITAKEAMEKVVESRNAQEKEKTIKCQEYFDALLKGIERTAEKGDIEIQISEEKLSLSHVSQLEKAGFYVTLYQGYYTISWNIPTIV